MSGAERSGAGWRRVEKGGEGECKEDEMKRGHGRSCDEFCFNFSRSRMR